MVKSRAEKQAQAILDHYKQFRVDLQRLEDQLQSERRIASEETSTLRSQVAELQQRLLDADERVLRQNLRIANLEAELSRPD